MGPCVYVVNHQDNFDLFITGRAVAKRTVTIGKKISDMFLSSVSYTGLPEIFS
jgi:hypothetical protein